MRVDHLARGPPAPAIEASISNSVDLEALGPRLLLDLLAGLVEGQLAPLGPVPRVVGVAVVGAEDEEHGLLGIDAQVEPPGAHGVERRRR